MNYQDPYDHLQSMMKTRQDNDETDHTSAVCTENETELMCLIVPGTVYDKKQTWQWNDQSIHLVYPKTETKMLRPISPIAICDEN